MPEREREKCILTASFIYLIKKNTGSDIEYSILKVQTQSYSTQVAQGVPGKATEIDILLGHPIP